MTPAFPDRMSSHYRADIDGLRGIAVLSVLLFHLGFYWFGGGYVGVDVFFVISGYLITRIIIDDVRSRRFSAARFYDRRIRRIFPALFCTLFLSLVAGAFLSTPTDFKSLGHSAAAVIAFVSNIQFWKEAGYFDAPADHKVLLHTWSLAVEEQFYIGFPLLLLAVRRFGRSRFGLWLILVALASLAVSVFSTTPSPRANFYLAPMRAWEFLLGAIVACKVLPASIGSRARNVLAAVGLGLLLIGIFRYDRSTPFPGLMALPPTIGTALIIYAGSTGTTLVGRILNIRPLVFIGLISYSLYLLHWPLIVFARQFLIVDPSRLQQVSLLIASIVLSALSWRFVEQPFRSGKHSGNRYRVFVLAGMTTIVFAAVVGFIDVTGGIPERFSAAARANDPAQDEEWKARDKCGQIRPARANLCTLGSASAQAEFLLWGDSHARAIASGVSASASKRSVAGYLAFTNMCPPLLGVSNDIRSRICAGFNDDILDYLEHRPELHTVILASNWAYYAAGTVYKAGDNGFLDVRLSDVWQRNSATLNNAALFDLGLNRTVRRLLEMHRRVVVVGPVPEVGYQVPAALTIASITGRDVTELIAPTRAEYEGRVRVVLDSLESLRHVPGVHIVDVAEKICDVIACRVVDAGHTLYIDGNHLSTYGSEYLAPLFDGVFD
jgi:peptidoglycan/LPS O-acetylase OafA/YrhL